MDTPEGSERYERVRYDSSSTHLLHQQHPLQSVHVSQLHFTTSILLLHSIHHSLFHLHHPSSLSRHLSLSQLQFRWKTNPLSLSSPSRALSLLHPLHYSLLLQLLSLHSGRIWLHRNSFILQFCSEMVSSLSDSSFWIVSEFSHRRDRWNSNQSPINHFIHNQN